MFPNFIIGGVAAGGTSFLASAISQHPEVYLPKKMRPEPHYFYKSWEYANGLSYYEKKYFDNIKHEKAIGEKSASYLFGGLVTARRIKKALPNIQLIFALRNPIERTYATYRYTVMQGLEELSFEEALENENTRIKKQDGIWKEIQPYNYTGRGFYAKQLKEYFKVFNKEQILILKSEDIYKNPYENFQKIFAFLNINQHISLKLPPHFTNLSVKDPKLQKYFRNFFGKKFDLIIESIRKENNPLIYADNNTEKLKIIELRQNLVHKKLPMSEYARKYLLEIFHQDMSELLQYIDFDISDWR